MYLKYTTPQPIRNRHAFWYWLPIYRIRLAITHIRLCIDIKHERQVLAKLTDSELLDIGVHRSRADAESQRTFFDVPAMRMDLHGESLDDGK